MVVCYIITVSNEDVPLENDEIVELCDTYVCLFKDAIKH